MAFKVKHVRFDIYQATCEIDPALDKEIQKIQKKLEDYANNTTLTRRHIINQTRKYQELLDRALETRDGGQTGLWDLAPLIEYACQDDINISMPAGNGDLVEIDKSTYYHSDENLIAFQITNLREFDIPAKKSIGRVRNPIPLNDDEYIGEFTQVLYDKRFRTLAIQSTKYGVGSNVIQLLFNKINKEMGGSSATLGRLLPILDPNEIAKASRAGRYKKLYVKCSDANYAQTNAAEYFAGFERLIPAEVNGYSMEVTIKFTESDKTKTLTPNEVQKVIRSFQTARQNPLLSPRGKDEFGVDVTYLDEHDNKYVTVDLLTPKMCFWVKVLMTARKIVASEELYDIVKEEYQRHEGAIFEIMRQE